MNHRQRVLNMLATKPTRLSRVAQLSSVDAMASLIDDLATARQVTNAFAEVLQEALDQYSSLEQKVINASAEVDYSSSVIDSAKSIISDFERKANELGLDPNNVDEYFQATTQFELLAASIEDYRALIQDARQYFNV